MVGYLTRGPYGGRVCDVNEEEYAEYLLWMEAALVHEPSRPIRLRIPRAVADSEESPPVPAESAA